MITKDGLVGGYIVWFCYLTQMLLCETLRWHLLILEEPLLILEEPLYQM